jgi:hypothetical protein
VYPSKFHRDLLEFLIPVFFLTSLIDSDVSFSDSRLKEDVLHLEDALGKLKLLEGKSFRWKDNFGGELQSESNEVEPKARKILGFIAQEVATVQPELVSQDSDGMMRVAYADLVPIIIEALKQQSLDLSMLENRAQSEFSHLEASAAQVTRQLSALSTPNISTGKSMNEKFHWEPRLKGRSRSESACCGLWKQFWFLPRASKVALATGVSLVLLAVIATALSISLAKGSVSQPPPPVAFRPQNYVLNGDFELRDPVSASYWPGQYFALKVPTSSRLRSKVRTHCFSFSTTTPSFLLEAR